jgi:hypothetical protein
MVAAGMLLFAAHVAAMFVDATEGDRPATSLFPARSS